MILGFLLLITFSFKGFAAVETASSMVPHGKIDENMGRDFMVMTKAGTRVGIEFSRGGKFQEAWGKNLGKGDELEPGESLISLSTAAQALEKKGIKARGYWLLEQDKKLGWIYEFSGTVISASTGKVLYLSTESSISESASADTSQRSHQSLLGNSCPQCTE